jgi:GNAT superfamily N-acetyltransferase
MFEEYFKEKKSLECFKNEYGFILYRIVERDLYIRDFYILPEHRRKGIAFAMTDKLVFAAKSLGCNRIVADVEPEDSNSTESLKFILAYGFELNSSDENEILLTKEI